MSCLCGTYSVIVVAGIYIYIYTSHDICCPETPEEEDIYTNWNRNCYVLCHQIILEYKSGGMKCTVLQSFYTTIIH